MALEPCIFPKLNDGVSSSSRWENHQIARSCVAETCRFCQEQDIQPQTVIAVAWAVILRRFTDIDSPILSINDFSGNQNSGCRLLRISGQGLTVSDAIQGDLKRFEVSNDQAGLVNTGIVTTKKALRPSVMGRGYVEELHSSVDVRKAYDPLFWVPLY